MGNTKELLTRVTALRKRLDQVRALAQNGETHGGLGSGESASWMEEAERIATDAGVHDLSIDRSINVELLAGSSSTKSPISLSHRAKRILEQGRELLQILRGLPDSFSQPRHPMQILYSDTLAMIDSAMRTVMLLPDSHSVQMHFCRGLEVTLTDVARRVNILHYGAKKERNEDEIVEKLIGVMKAIRESKADVRESLEAISREILTEAKSCEPLHFVHRAPNDVYGFTACTGINTARILARVVRHEPKLRNRPVDVISSGLIHDIGLLEIKGDFLARTGQLTDRERRELERHPRTGAEMIKRIYVDHPDVIAAVLMHHERLDGTGYPEGTQGNQIETMARLLAVCSTYAGLCCDRPHRPSRPPRTALADTLLMAEQGLLDPLQAEHLLSLSFYPVGSLVELAQGEIAMVVAVGGSGKAGGNPSRPVVAVLTDRRGNPLPKPHHLDLGEAEDYSIARILTPRESKDHLSNDLPQWAA